MHGGSSDGRWLAPIAVIVAIAAATFAFALRPSRHDTPYESATLGAQRAPASSSPRPAPTPSLYEVLRAADILARAGAIPTPVAAPTEAPLIDVLRAADELAKAGLLPAPTEVPLIDALNAAVALKAAGALPEPTMQAAAAPPPRSAPRPQQLSAPTPPPPPTPSPVPPGATGWYDAAYIGRVWDLLNQQRTRAGLPPLASEPRLTQAAAGYARVLSDNNWFAHVGPDGSTLVSRVEAAGFPFNVKIGEILAWGTQGWAADQLVRAWMNSPTHRSEILDPVYTRAGASCYFKPADGVTVRCVVNFAGG